MQLWAPYIAVKPPGLILLKPCTASPWKPPDGWMGPRVWVHSLPEL